MDKKELKEYIRNNGFFVKTHTNSITREKLDNTALASVPNGENIILFEGVFSQNYGKGEKSRNGYKIDQNGWDLSDYKLNPIILYQHNSDEPIGRCVNLKLNENGDLYGQFYVDLELLDDKDQKRVKNGYVKGISTGHITLEDCIEDNETGERYTIEEAFEKYNRSQVINAMWGESDILTYVVTKALMLESSMVTIGSNEEAMATHNSLQSSIQHRYDHLIKNHTMTTEELKAQQEAEAKAKAEEGKNTETETDQETPNEQDNPDTSTATEPSAELVEANAKIAELTNEVDTLKNEVATLKNSLAENATNSDTKLKELNEIVEKLGELVLAQNEGINQVLDFKNNVSKRIDTNQFKQDEKTNPYPNAFTPFLNTKND